MTNAPQHAADRHTRISRRQALQAAAFAAGIATCRSAFAATNPQPGRADITLEPDDVVLFQGDSITDAGRDRNAQQHPNHSRALGTGYAMLAAAELRRDHAPVNLRIYNRGISGNKVPDLDARWDVDCLALAPRIVSILIGVNDIWHKLGGNYDGTVADYTSQYTRLLARTREALPDTTIICCEPFVLRCGAVNDNWFPEFDERRAAAKQVAQDARALWVPFQSMFDAAVEAGTNPAYWAGDGVHPTLAGHALMAEAWRKVVGV